MSYVFLLLMIGVIAWLMFRITRRINQKEPLRPTPRMTNTAQSLGTAPPPELDRWSVEMQDIARDALAQIDTKMRALEYLTTKATAAAQRLDAALAIQYSTNANAATSSPPPARGAVASMSYPSPESLNTNNQAEMLERTTGRTHHDDTHKRDTRHGDTPTDGGNTDGDSRRRHIYELADRGNDATAIAVAVGRPLGEIELILGLRQAET
jgi:hypothetical protein